LKSSKVAYESDIEGKVAAWALEELGIFSIKLKRTQERGYPDRMFLVRGGRPLFVEFKRPGEAPRPYQLLIHERLRHAGYEVQVHDNVEEATAAICAAAKKSAPRNTAALLRNRE